MTAIVGEIETGATVHFVVGAGHGFGVPGRPEHTVHAELSGTTAEWIADLI